MAYVFGIDLGTTYSCIAYIDEYGKTVVLKNSDGDSTTPSVVMVESESNIIVGTEAKRSIEVEPDKTVQFIKRKMGKENYYINTRLMNLFIEFCKYKATEPAEVIESVHVNEIVK